MQKAASGCTRSKFAKNIELAALVRLFACNVCSATNASNSITLEIAAFPGNFFDAIRDCNGRVPVVSARNV